MPFDSAINARAIELNRLLLETCAAGAGMAPASSMAAGHLANVLLRSVMRWDPSSPSGKSADHLVCSDSRQALAGLGVCVGLGVTLAGTSGGGAPVTKNDLLALGTGASLLGRALECGGLPISVTPAGAVGCTLALACGMALAERRAGSSKRIFCLLNEEDIHAGATWDALAVLRSQRLDNLFVIFCVARPDKNATIVATTPSLAQRLEAIQISAKVIDGHSPKAISAALEPTPVRSSLSSTSRGVIIAQTMSGWGAASIQGPAWAEGVPTGDRLKKALAELATTQLQLCSALTRGTEIRPTPPVVEVVQSPAAGAIPTFEAAMKASDMATVLARGTCAPWAGFALAARALMRTRGDVFAIEVESANSAARLANDRALAGCSYTVLMAGPAQVALAAGLASGGGTAFCIVGADLVGRCLGAFEAFARAGSAVKLVVCNAALWNGAGSSAASSCAATAVGRALSTLQTPLGGPACTLIQPADASSAFALGLAMASRDGACLMRLSGAECEILYPEPATLRLGQPERMVEGRDILLVASGSMVHECNAAIEALDKLGVDATLVDLHSLPMEEETMLDLANRNEGRVLVIEDCVGGASGPAMADACAASGDGFTVVQLHPKVTVRATSDHESRLKSCGLTAGQIAARAADMLGVRN